jgi:hypothetical protein
MLEFASYVKVVATEILVVLGFKILAHFKEHYQIPAQMN